MSGARYRHSLFFVDEGEACEAEAWLRNNLEDDGYEAEELDRQFDADSCNWEVCFSTPEPLDVLDQMWIFRYINPSVYALNCEVY